MNLNGVKIGLAITGSFCTFDKVYKEVENLVSHGAIVTPIFSYNASTIDTRFGKALEWIEKFEKLTGNKSIMTITEAEPVGPKNYFDILVAVPCTENATKLQNSLQRHCLC
ncbi:MAG: spoVFB [Clostridia bacterium]|nr:spoVFB [Clostridia bacterium]